MTAYSPREIEKEVQAYWKKEGTIERIVELDPKKPKFYLLDGPPYVNGIPHVGHIKTTVFKDVWGKFKHMQGFSVWWQPGFDCGGLPIENAVEKKLGIEGKNDIIEKIGAEKFIDECKALAKGNEPVWLNLYKKIAAWRGWVEPYLTSDNSYKESGWWTIKNMHDNGQLFEGQKPGFWCPSCQTVLSGYEVTDSYKNVEDPSIFIKFPVMGYDKVDTAASSRSAKDTVDNNEAKSDTSAGTRKTKEKGGKSQWDKTFLLVWTTTPWTLPANVAVAAHPDEQYVKAELSNGEKLILAEKRLVALTDMDIGFRILEKFKGRQLEGLKYEPVLDVPMQLELQLSSEKNSVHGEAKASHMNRKDNAHKVILSVPVMKMRVASKTKVKKATEAADEFSHIVDMETGSGLVHIAPGHGDVDNRIGRHYGLPEPSPVDEKGCLTKEAGRFAGMFVKKADAPIMERIEGRGLMLNAGKVTHSYPLCWRCKSPLIYRMSRQWFVRMDNIRDVMQKENAKIRWLPGFAAGRMAVLLADSPDWAVTRQRFWGIPLPVWKCGKCKAVKVIGSLAELKKSSSARLPENIEIDKVSMDKVKLKCKCGGEMSRDPDIMDVWFDSSIAPWASLGYPHQNKRLFESLWPVDLVDESQDQVRGWFYYLLFSSIANFARSSYETCCLNGWTLDEKGEKMSKSLGNVVLAEDACKELGADLLRLYCCADVAPWDTQKFSIRGAKDLGRALNIFWNTYVFMQSYGDKHKNLSFTPPKVAGLKAEDKWMVSRINTVIDTVTKNMHSFEFHAASRSLVDFILNDFSRLYIKIIRDRVSPWYEGRDKAAAQAAMNYVMERLLKLMAPFTPFIAEKMHLELFGSSVHLADWPKADRKMIDAKLEERMIATSQAVESLQSARQEAGIKLRWPLEYAEVPNAGGLLDDVIANLANVMKVGSGKGIKLGKPDMETALLRELSRKIQVLRKESGMKFHESIGLELDTDKKTQISIETMKKQLMAYVGAKSIEFKKIAKSMGSLEFEGSKIAISFRKV